MKTTIRQKFAKTLALILPGIFLLGFNIGTGSVTAMAKAGATYGMSLLWTIVASCFTTYFMINLYGKYTLATGETALQAFRKHIHPGMGIFFIVALTAGVSGSVMGVMGIVADISYEWSKTIIDGGIQPVYFAGFFIALVYFIFWNGKTQFFERALAVIVAIMAACFLLNFFIMMPPPIDILKGMIPNLPEVPADQGKGPFLVIASMVGTTVFSGLFIIRTTLVKEAGWTINDMKKQRNDAIVSVSTDVCHQCSYYGRCSRYSFQGRAWSYRAFTDDYPFGTTGREICHCNLCLWNYCCGCIFSIPECIDAALVAL